jgi:hypothetical protein
MHAGATVAEIEQAGGAIVSTTVVGVRMRMIVLVVVIAVRVLMEMIVIVCGSAMLFRVGMFRNDRSYAATDRAHHSTSISATRNSSPAVIRT